MVYYSRLEDVDGYDYIIMNTVVTLPFTLT
jgi:hypothetical protein